MMIYLSANKALPNILFCAENPFEFTISYLNNLYLHKFDPKMYPLRDCNLYLLSKNN